MESNNVELLFETNVISEIEEIEKKLKEEVEKKVDDLKQIVGEKYRDLIEVSDSIKLMNDKCATILNSIDELNQFLQNNCLKIKLKNDKEIFKNDQILLAINYHIIVETPAKIWSCLDSGDVLAATFYFYQAQFIFNSISDESSHRIKFLQKFRFTFDGFANKIIDHCWSIIESLDNIFDESKIALSLICISIIKKIQAQELFECFLERKYNQLSKLFEKNLNFSEVLLLFFKIIFDTSKLVFLIFWDQGSSKSLLFRKALEIPKFKFNSDFGLNSTLSSLISENIQNLKLEASHLNKGVLNEVIFQNFKKYIENLKTNFAHNLSQTAANVNSIGSIFQILKEIDQLSIQQNKLLDWEYVFNLLLGYNLNIWDYYLKDSILKVLQNLIDEKLNQEFQSFKDCINSTINRGSFSSDILSIVWDENVNENFCSDKKTFAISDDIYDLCQNLNSKLNVILDEIDMIDKKSLSISLIPKQDCEHLKLYFLKAFNYQFELLLNTFESYSSQTENFEIILLIARLARSMIFFSPSIKACFQIIHEDNEWSKAKKKLVEFSYQLLVKYLIQSSQKYIEKLREDMKPLLFIKFVEISLNWEEIKLEDNLEDGKVVNTTIRIPFQISIPIFECINSISILINSIGAHTIPQKVINNFLFEISLQLNSIYQELYKDLSQSNQLPSSARQTRALQLYFDLLFFEQSLNRSKNDKIKKETVQLIHSTLSSYESLIDPFDLHVFYPHLQTALSKSIKSTSLLFGTLFASTSFVETNKLTQNLIQQEFHNSMAFYCLNNNFPLLNLPNLDKSCLYNSDLK